MEAKRWMNVREVAEYLGVSNSKIYKLVESHSIPYRRIGSVLRFGTIEIDDWMRKQIVKPIRREPQIVATNVVDNVQSLV